MKNQLKTFTEGDILIVNFYGELDNTSTFRYKERIADIIDRDTSLKNIIFDFSSVSFLDSSGLGLILGRLNQLRERSGRLIICGANAYITKILNMSGITKFIDTYESLGSARGVLN